VQKRSDAIELDNGAQMARQIAEERGQIVAQRNRFRHG
jgi:hypothetical protein